MILHNLVIVNLLTHLYMHFDQNFFLKANGVPEPCDNGLRILSWNLDGLSVEKASNPGNDP